MIQLDVFIYHEGIYDDILSYQDNMSCDCFIIVSISLCPNGIAQYIDERVLLEMYSAKSLKNSSGGLPLKYA